jgi:thiol-disulfide isomerase/thioredoxin
MHISAPIIAILFTGSTVLCGGTESTSTLETQRPNEEDRAFQMVIQPFVAGWSDNAEKAAIDFRLLRQRMETFWTEFPDADRSATLLSSYMGLFGKVHPDEVAKEWASFSSCRSPKAAELARVKIRFFELAKQPLELKFKAIDGRDVDVAAYHGRIVIINFWATWCKPCIDEIPTLRRLYEKYHDRGLEVIGISLDRTDDREKLREVVVGERLMWPQYCDGKVWQNEIASYFAVHALPTSFLVGKDGKITEIDVGALKLQSEIDRLLKQ